MTCTLSVCLIARNEQEHLPRALASVKGVADEVVVTDTGSTDSTVSIADDHGASIHHFAWCDDFSAARNHCLSQAHGQWVLWLDADEELLPESAAMLRRCLRRVDAMGYYVLRQDLADLAYPDRYTQMWQLRLFRRRPELSFQGRCHPHFEPSLEIIARQQHKAVFPSDITLRHYGYAGALRGQKLQRAKHLLELELRDRLGQLYYLIEYGRTLLAMEDPKGHEAMRRAAEAVLAHRKEPRAPLPLAVLVLEYLLVHSPKNTQSPLSRREVRELAQRWFPHAPPLIWLQAQDDFRGNRMDQAAAGLRRLAEMGRTGRYDYLVSFDPRILGDDALLNLGVCYTQMGQYQEARRCFRKLLGGSTRSSEAARNLKMLEGLAPEPL